jgi:orotate phosphoribosyltransferase
MLTDDILSALPAREGHFVTESGYHTNLWFSLEALFVHPPALTPLLAALGERLRPYGVSAVCGPLVGGALIAQTLAIELGVDFYFAEPVNVERIAQVAPVEGTGGASGLFGARYRLPDGLKASVRGARVALVDDLISAGSSARATARALADAGASVAVVGTLLTLGSVGVDHFAERGLPVEALGRGDFAMWTPDVCPLCQAGTPLQRRT